MLDHYRSARYKDGGRGELVSGIRLFDCYGLVRAVSAEQFGLLPLPPLATVCPSAARQVHRASSEAVREMQPCAQHAGPWRCAGRAS